LLAFTLIVGAAALLTPRFDLPPSYHDFADKRVWLGFPHFGDVASNLLFAIAGLWGLLWLGRKSSRVKFVCIAKQLWSHCTVSGIVVELLKLPLVPVIVMR
jgi:hypothetical protein